MSLSHLFEQLSEIATERADEAFDKMIAELPADVREGFEKRELALARRMFHVGYSVGLGESPAFMNVLNRRHSEMQ